MRQPRRAGTTETMSWRQSWKRWFRSRWSSREEAISWSTPKRFTSAASVSTTGLAGGAAGAASALAVAGFSGAAGPDTAWAAASRVFHWSLKSLMEMMQVIPGRVKVSCGSSWTWRRNTRWVLPSRIVSPSSSGWRKPTCFSLTKVPLRLPVSSTQTLPPEAKMRAWHLEIPRSSPMATSLVAPRPIRTWVICASSEKLRCCWLYSSQKVVLMRVTWAYYRWRFPGCQRKTGGCGAAGAPIGCGSRESLSSPARRPFRCGSRARRPRPPPPCGCPG